MRKIIYTGLILFALFPAVAGANFIQDIFSWYGSSADKSVGDLRVLTVPQGGTGAATLTGCLEGNGTGAVTGTGSACASGGGSDPFTHPATGVFATTTNFIIGSDSTASSTLIGDLNITGNSTTTQATTTNFAISSLSSELLKVDGNGSVLEAISGTDYEVPLTFGDGLTRTVNDVDVDTTQNITNLSNLTTNALVITSSGNGTLGAYAGTSCTNQFVRSLSALGVATCATVSSSDVSLADLTATDTTLTFSGTYNGSTARTIGLNLGNANTWTALQNFSANASTTQLTVTGNTYLATTGGNVGIGTTNPTQALTLGNGGRLQINSAGDDKTLNIYHNDSHGIIETSSGGLFLDPENTTAYMYDGTNAFTFYMYNAGTVANVFNANGISYFNGGNLGIGTTTPPQKLSIDSATDTFVNINSTNVGGDSRITFTNTGDGNNDYMFGRDDDGVFRIYRSQGTKFSLDTLDRFYFSGNVGIGDNTPASLFSVGSGDLFQIDSNGAIIQVAGLELPNSATAGSIADALGEIAYDTTSGNVVVATTTSATPFVLGSATSTLASFSMASTSPDAISGGIKDIPINRTKARVAIAIYCSVDSGTSQQIFLSDGTNDTNTITCTTTPTLFSLTANNSWTAYENWRVELATKTGTWDYLDVDILGYKTSD